MGSQYIQITNLGKKRSETWSNGIITVLALLALEASAAPLVSRDVVAERLGRATRGNRARQEALVGLFREAGCRDLTEQRVRRSEFSNVICTQPGTGKGVVIVSAHYDMTGPGTGAADNWGSASLLASILESFAKAPRRSTLVFIGFADEELGLVGAKHYVASLTAKEHRAIRAVINMDGAGMAATRVWDTKSDASLMRLARATARELDVELHDHSLDGAGIMDSFVFHERGIPTLSLHGLAPGNYHIPHSRLDVVDAVRVADLYDTYRLVVKLVETLDAR